MPLEGNLSESVELVIATLRIDTADLLRAHQQRSLSSVENTQLYDSDLIRDSTLSITRSQSCAAEPGTHLMLGSARWRSCTSAKGSMSSPLDPERDVRERQQVTPCARCAKQCAISLTASSVLSDCDGVNPRVSSMTSILDRTRSKCFTQSELSNTLCASITKRAV